jgi:F-type H+-transporting ATPase subunit alpha
VSDTIVVSHLPSSGEQNMVEIKPDEISAILRQQLSNFNAGADLEEVGTVLQVGDGIARVYGLAMFAQGELVEFENGVQGDCPEPGRR